MYKNPYIINRIHRVIYTLESINMKEMFIYLLCSSLKIILAQKPKYYAE